MNEIKHVLSLWAICPSFSMKCLLCLLSIFKLFSLYLLVCKDLHVFCTLIFLLCVCVSLMSFLFMVCLKGQVSLISVYSVSLVFTFMVCPFYVLNN